MWRLKRDKCRTGEKSNVNVRITEGVRESEIMTKDVMKAVRSEMDPVSCSCCGGGPWCQPR